MAGLFDKHTDNVLDNINADEALADHFEGDFFNGAESDFLGIAIGKKAKARKAARRRDRQAARKYKLETERIRALQGQPKQNVVGDITKGLVSVAGAVFGGGGGQQQEAPVYDETYQTPPQNSSYTPNYRQLGDNSGGQKNQTLLFVIIGVAVVAAAFILKK